MKIRARIISGLVHAVCFVGIAAAAPTPVDLSEMPSVDRVLRDFQGTDTKDTAFRQMGALWELRVIMDTLIGRKYEAVGHRPYIPENVQQLEKTYTDAAWKIDHSFADSQSTLEAMKAFDAGKKRYRDEPNDPLFGQELFKKYFSPAFRSRFDQALANPKAAAEAASGTPTKIPTDDEALATLKQLLSESKNPNDQALLAEMQKLKSGAEFKASMQASLLTPAPRPTDAELLTTAFTAVGNYMENDPQISKALTILRSRLAGASTRKPIPQGLRMNGEYSGDQGLRITFTAESAVVAIGELLLTDEYAVRPKDGRVVVVVQHGSDAPKDALELVLQSDGTLSGSAEVTITGQVVVGHHMETTGGGPVTHQTTEQRTLTPLEAGQYPDAVRNGQTYTVDVPVTQTSYAAPTTTSVPDYASKTERCAVGILRPVTKH